MLQHTYYTAVGRYLCKTDNSGRTYPVVICKQKEHCVDLQEMTLWTALNWRLLDHRQAEQQYWKLARGLLPAPPRSFDDCLNRLCVRGLVAEGKGETGLDALYDLLSDLYIRPAAGSTPQRLCKFLKMTMLDGVAVSTASKLLRKDRRSAQESQIMRLSQQTLLSTAELVKCVENGVTDLSTEEKVLDALYGDTETTCDNIGFIMHSAESMQAVVVAVSNLYLRQQIILERV